MVRIVNPEVLRYDPEVFLNGPGPTPHPSKLEDTPERTSRTPHPTTPKPKKPILRQGAKTKKPKKAKKPIPIPSQSAVPARHLNPR